MIPGQNPTAERPDITNAPQNDYRSYDAESVFTDPKTWNNDRVSHERLSWNSMIARANGGTPTDKMTGAVGRFVDDSENF